jgi:hypothetical protein
MFSFCFVCYLSVAKGAKTSSSILKVEIVNGFVSSGQDIEGLMKVSTIQRCTISS